jgi:hypothetical protein
MSLVELYYTPRQIRDEFSKDYLIQTHLPYRKFRLIFIKNWTSMLLVGCKLSLDTLFFSDLLSENGFSGSPVEANFKNLLVLLGCSKLTHRTDVGCGRFADIRAGASEKWLPCIFWWGGFMVSCSTRKSRGGCDDFRTHDFGPKPINARSCQKS